MKEEHSLTRSAGVISLSTLLSRVLGLIRDMLTASFFGTTPAMSAFVTAFTIPNLFRRLLGEGALTAAFVPVFTEYLEKEGKEAGWRLANAVISLLMVVLASLVVAGFIIIWMINRTFALDEQFTLVFQLLQVMLPYLFFICLVGLAMAILNSFRHFAVPALAPVVLNIVWIASILFLCPRFGSTLEQKIFGLALGIVIGGVIQLGIQFPVLKRKGLRFRFTLNWKHPAVKKIVYLMGPSVLGLAIVQLNIVVDRFLAWAISPEAPSTLYYGNRLVQLPLGIFGIALATATLPVLASQVARKKIEEFKKTFSYALRTVILVTVPASVGLIVLRRPIIRLIFQRKEFGLESTEATAWVLLFYSTGLLAFAGLKIVTQAFYAFQDTKTPVKVGVGAMLLNLGLNLLVVFNPYLKTHLREGGLALSTSLAAVMNILILIFLLRRRVGFLPGKEILLSLGKVCVASGVMALSCWLCLNFIQIRLGGAGGAARLAQVIFPLLVGIGVFWGVAMLLKIRVIREVRLALFRKKAPGVLEIFAEDDLERLDDE